MPNKTTDVLIERLRNPIGFAVLHTEAMQAIARIEKAEAALVEEQLISAKLYLALRQMRGRRGVDIDDIDLVLGALEGYENSLRKMEAYNE